MDSGAYDTSGNYDPSIKASQVIAVANTISAYSEHLPTQSGQSGQNTTSGLPPPNPAYEDQTQQNIQAMNVQSNANPPPEPPEFCTRVFNWVPVHWLAFVGGCLFASFPIINMVVYPKKLNFLSFFIDIYLIVFGLIVMAVEIPAFPFLRNLQIVMYSWARFMSRMWGRATFYIFISVLSFSQLTTKSFYIPAIAGMYIVLVGIFMLIIARMACKKYLRIFVYVAAGREGDVLEGVFERKFEELDMDGDGFLIPDDIVRMAKEAGRDLSNSEKHAIASFLDESCNGKVSKADWVRQFTTHNDIKIKMKFL